MKKDVDLGSFRWRYKRANRKGKSRLLTELCDLYGYNRKYLVQFFNQLTGKKYVRRGAKLKYTRTEELLEPLKRIWLASDQMCSKRLKEAIPIWLPHYEETYGDLSAGIRRKLLEISTGTLDKLLKPYRIRYKRHGLSGTKPGYLLKNQIPIRTDHWDVSKPGFMEADSVAHCGNSLVTPQVLSVSA